RFTLRNISNKQLGPLFGTDVGGNLVYGIKGPEDDQYQKHGVIIVYERFDHRNTSVSTAREHFNSEIPLFLRPGQETAHSVAFGRWSDRDYKPQVAFPIPGTYTLKCGYLVDGQKNKHVYNTVEVQVQEPVGPDKQVFYRLTKDPDLVRE